jgi:hypothetical protein
VRIPGYKAAALVNAGAVKTEVVAASIAEVEKYISTSRRE